MQQIRNKEQNMEGATKVKKTMSKAERKDAAVAAANAIKARAGQKIDIEEYVQAFATEWSNSEDHIYMAAKTFHNAVAAVGWKDAFMRFDERFGQIGEYNFRLLDEIGADSCDVRVWFLPNYMHGIRYMDVQGQRELLNMKRLKLRKFSTEKQAIVDLGHVNQSDWRVAFDRDRNVIRTDEEMLLFIHKKKREFKVRQNWKISRDRKSVVFDRACTLTIDELRRILELVGEP